MEHDQPTVVLHWNYRGFTEFPIQKLQGDEAEVTDIYLKENLISQIPDDIRKFVHLESLYLSGNDITELPAEISTLKFLKCLDLSGNRIRVLPGDIGDVRRLKFLILDENELTELPLRIAELRSLRYLSVCDNKLKWLPQRPVYNYHHCEFRFWRNTSLKVIPYSLWYHMFRGQQTRSLNIGCLKIPKYKHTSNFSRCRLKLAQGSREWEYDVDLPSSHRKVFEDDRCSPPSLYEICRRNFYQVVTNAAKRFSTESSIISIYNDNRINMQLTDFGNGNFNCDLNGNNLNQIDLKDLHHTYAKNRETKDSYVPKDIIETYFSFLPYFIKQELSNGPVSRCENVRCKMPVFDYACYGFCIGKIILIDDAEDVILSASLCSKSCLDAWKRGKSNLCSWTLVDTSEFNKLI